MWTAVEGPGHPSNWGGRGGDLWTTPLPNLHNKGCGLMKDYYAVMEVGIPEVGNLVGIRCYACGAKVCTYMHKWPWHIWQPIHPHTANVKVIIKLDLCFSVSHWMTDLQKGKERGACGSWLAISALLFCAACLQVSIHMISWYLDQCYLYWMASCSMCRSCGWRRQ